MIRAFSTLGCPELALDDALALAARYGLDGIELRALEGTVELPRLFGERFGTPRGLAEHLARRGARVVSLDASFRMVTGAPEGRAALLAYVPWAEAAGIPRLRIFDGGERGDAAELDAAAATLAWWRAERARHGWAVDLMVETHDCLAHPETLAHFVAREPDCALLWDAHHTWRKGGADPAETWRVIRAQTVHVHVKDSLSRPGPRLPYSYVLPGAGEFPMAPLLARLRADRYAGVLSLEWEKLWHAELPALDVALEAAARTGWWSIT